MKALVQYDGSNFYNKIKILFPQKHLTHFNYAGLAEYLANFTDIHIIYYVGEVKYYREDIKSKTLYAKQKILFNNLKNQSIEIKKGYLLKNNGIYHEKGVDVQIAVDIVMGAIKHHYHRIYIISSDSDLIPAINEARNENVEIIYIGFEKLLSKALINNCSSYIIITKELLKRFFTI